MNNNINNLFSSLNIIFKKFNLLKDIDNYILMNNLIGGSQNNNCNIGDKTVNDIFNKKDCENLKTIKTNMDTNIKINNDIIDKLFKIISTLKLQNIDLENEIEENNIKLDDFENIINEQVKYFEDIIQNLHDYNDKLNNDYTK